MVCGVDAFAGDSVGPTYRGLNVTASAYVCSTCWDALCISALLMTLCLGGVSGNTTS